MRASRQSIILVTAWLSISMAGSPLHPRLLAQEPVSPGRISIQAFIRMHALNGALVLDVRSTEAYRAGHIPGAIHVPLDHIEARAEELQSLVQHRLVVTYCSCPEEHASLAAVKVLDANGIPNAAALVGGYPAWLGKGGKVERAGNSELSTQELRANLEPANPERGTWNPEQ